MSRLLAGIAILGGGAGLAAAGYFLNERRIQSVAEEKPERDETEGAKAEPAPTPATATRWKAVNDLLPRLRDLADSTGIPLGLLVGWVAKESHGLLEEYGSPRSKPTKYDERGYFQLMPSESKALHLDHHQLSTDPDYSVMAGGKLVDWYTTKVRALGPGVIPEDTSFFWRVVKLFHTMGPSAAKKVIRAANAAGAASSWDVLEKYALDHNDDLLRATGHSPKKWFPLVDEVYRVGKPFGFGDEATLVSGLPAYTDADRTAIARVLDRASSLARSCYEQQAVAWVCRNQAARAGKSPSVCGGSVTVSPSPWSLTVAGAVLAQPVASDPTSGAVAFRSPRMLADAAALVGVYREAVRGNDAIDISSLGEQAKAAERALDFDRRLEAAGLRVVAICGDLELLG